MMSPERTFTRAAAWTLLGLAAWSVTQQLARADEHCPLCQWKATSTPLLSKIPGLAHMFQTSAECDSAACNAGSSNSAPHHTARHPALDAAQCAGGSCESSKSSGATVAQATSLQCNSAQCNSAQCNSAQCNSAQCNSAQCNSAQCNSAQCNSAQCNSAQCNSAQCKTGACGASQASDAVLRMLPPPAAVEQLGIDCELLPFDWSGAFGAATGKCGIVFTELLPPGNNPQQMVWFARPCSCECAARGCAGQEKEVCGQATSAETLAATRSATCAAGACCAETASLHATRATGGCQSVAKAENLGCPGQTTAGACGTSCEHLAQHTAATTGGHATIACAGVPACRAAAGTCGHVAAMDVPICSHAQHAELATENATLRVMLDGSEQVLEARAEMLEEMLNLMAEKLMLESKLSVAEKLAAERERTMKEVFELKSENLRLQAVAEATEARYAAEKGQLEVALENERLKLRVAELERQASEVPVTARKAGGKKNR